MQKQVVTCVNLGMNRDTGISQLSEKNANYAFENYNIRITAVNDNTLYTVTNEKGTKNSGITLVGKFLGSCILNDYIVIFTLTTSTMQPYSDYIYRVKYNTNDGKLENNILYSGNLFFDLSCPIEAIGYYESEEVQKVYWVDGKNPNRFINIANTSEGSAPNYSSGDSYLFDFLGHINHIPKVDIIKNYSKAGTFQAGTILYFATYFNKYGVETCIVWLSDLLYISAIDRGAKPEELVTCSFDFTINNIDTSYDYIRIYAAYRAGLNGSAEGRLVTEIEIPENSSSIVFSDLGNDYLNYNAEDIHYIGGQNIIASTLDYKQDTLFLGDIQLKNTSDDLSDLRDVFRTACEQNLKTYEGITINESPYIQWEYKKISDKNSTADSYVQQINKSQLDIAGFKYREIYRFGILFMDEYGEWTSALWIGDKYCDLAPCSPFVIPVLLYVDIYDYENGQYKATGEYISVWDETDLEYKGYYILANIENQGLKIYSYWYSPLPLSQLYERIYLNNNGYKDTELDVSTTSYISAQDLHIDGVYIAQAKFTGVGSDLDNTLSAKYKAYRLLVAETDYLNRRIITLGVINPTMFNFKDRENNLPYSINSWIFRPRNSEITHQHYDTLPLQNSDYAEVLGIMKKEVPGYKKGELLDDDSLNSFVLLFAPNYLAGCRLDYRLVYYNITSCLDYKQSNYSNILTVEDGKTLSNDTLTGLEAALTIAHDNNCLTEEALELELCIPYNYENYKVISEGLIKETTWEKVITSLISKITEDTKAEGEKIVISQSMLPTADLMKKAASEGDGSKVGIYLGLAVATVAAVVASIFSFGAAAAATAPALVLAWSAAASAATIGAIGGASAIGAIAEDDRYNENAKDIDKQLSLKSIYNVLDGHSLSLRRGWAYFANKVLLLMFGENHSVPEFVWGNNLNLLGESSNVYMMGGRLTLVSEKEEAKKDKLASFYVDESIVTLNSPDILEVKQYIDKSSSYDLNLIGTIPIDTVQEDYIMYAENGLSNTATPLLGVASNKEALVNGFLYQDSEWPSSYSGGTIQATAAVQAYKVFMWNRNTSWSLWFPGIDLKDVYGNAVETAPAKPIKKIFANYKGSNSTTYLPINTIYKTTINPIIVFDSPTTSLSTITYKNTSYFYQGNLDTIVIPPNNYTLIANNNSNEFYYTSDSDTKEVAIHCKDPIPLRYNTLPHAVISIDNTDSPILPLTNAFEDKTMHDLYEDVTLSDYDIQGVTETHDGIYFKQDILTGWEISSPYLFLGEIVKKNFNYNDWYGGTSDYALQQLNWNICSKTIEGFQNETDVTWGDTYYQRWECLKTYPLSELEVNSNVEVLSFMLESHTNLDGRSDTNRGTYNLINLRPSNTNIFNPVYNQSDNFFSYKILDEKFDKTVFENLVIWSLSKSNLDNIDKWTSISAVNSLSLDGKLGKITRIININDSLLAFQELGISAINYNLLAALSTYEGIPLLMGNTGKVTGYTKVTEDIGCSNKWALVLTGAGLFFIDNNTKSLYLYTANKGITNISKVGNFSMWFKDNIVEGEWNPSNNVGAFRLNYDKVTLDLYIHNDTSCLLYNTYLQTFTSFMSYKNTPLLLNHKGKSIAFWQAASTVMPYYMFEGSYNIIYGSPLNYYIEYRVNPSPYTDNLFTNYEYVADWTDPTTNSNDSNLFGAYRMDHFDIVKAWNEYLEGELSATTSLTGKHPIKTKFRIWRGDIPRNGDAAYQRVLRGDRMRNPWIHLRFTKNSPGDSKMTFHNLNVIYYK